jgi:hypothetical protein
MATTQLSVTATPGARYSFSLKARVRDTTQFTELSVTATPGARHSFTAKASASRETPRRGLVDDWLEIEDEEILEMITVIVSSGILDG